MNANEVFRADNRIDVLLKLSLLNPVVYLVLF